DKRHYKIWCSRYIPCFYKVHTCHW
ncbi:hypothetical protein AZZ88_004471, partial [Escherichia coli]